MVTAAAVLAFVVGGLGLLIGSIASPRSAASERSAGSASLLGCSAVLVLVVAAIQIWGGVQAIHGQGRPDPDHRGRRQLVLNIITMICAFESRSLLSFVIPVLIMYFLMTPESKAWFDRVGAKHF